MSVAKQILERKVCIEIPILGDGNCFYRCISMFIENTQENHIYYRNLIYNYICTNRHILQFFFPINENENQQDFIRRYDNFISSIKSQGTYAGDFEISSASIALDKKITVYRNDIDSYHFINEYSQINRSTYQEKDHILLQFKNNNHFNLLIKNDYKNNNKIDIEENYDRIHLDIENNIKILKKRYSKF